MIINIRQAVFETNSSSTHSLTMCSKNEFDAWRKGEVWLNGGYYGSTSQYVKTRFVNREQIIDIATNSEYPFDVDLTALDADEFADAIRDEGTFQTYDQFCDGDTEEDEYTTASGEVVVAVSSYSYDS